MSSGKEKACAFLLQHGYETIPEDTGTLFHTLRNASLVLHNAAVQSRMKTEDQEKAAFLFEQASLAQIIAFELLSHEGSLESYQKAAMRTCPLKDPREMLFAAQMGLCGEVGEIADHLKKHLYHGHAFDQVYLEKEAGDVLWYLALFCEALGTHLSHVAEMNIEKLKQRYPEGFSSERSQQRE